jgi:hypothetical protein
VLFSAAEESMLIGVLANWEPQLDWPGRARHIPRLAAGAQALLRGGLIQVYEQHLGPGETRFLTDAEALAVLNDPNSWWRSEDAGEERDEGVGTGHGDGEDNFYALTVTDMGSKVMHTRGDDELYGFLRH